VTVDCIRRGERHRITAVPEDATLLPASVEVEGMSHSAPVTIEVPRLVRMMVRVLDQTGQPIPHVQVLVIVPGKKERRDGPHVVNDVRGYAVGAISADPEATFDTSIYAARTDGGGTCIVYGIDGRDDLVLGVRIHGGIERTEGVTFGPGHASRELTVER
jgi:hypothetical protein